MEGGGTTTDLFIGAGRVSLEGRGGSGSLAAGQLERGRRNPHPDGAASARRGLEGELRGQAGGPLAHGVDSPVESASGQVEGRRADPVVGNHELEAEVG